MRCFVREGYTKTTTAMIAAEAGVSRGAMMHHFSARAEVMKAVVAYLHERRLDEYRELMTANEISENISREDIRRSVKAAWTYHNLPTFVAYRNCSPQLERMKNWVRSLANSKRNLASS